MKSKEGKIKNILMGSAVLLIVFCALFLIKAAMYGHFASIETLRVYISGFGAWGPLVLMLIQALQVVVPVLPGFLGCIVGALLFGSFAGFWVNYIGISAGSIAAYWLARKLGVAFVRRILPMEKYSKFIKWLNARKSYTVVLFLAILLPLAPDDFLCYFSGLLEMSTKKFIAIILIAKPWCILFYSVFFTQFL